MSHIPHLAAVECKTEYGDNLHKVANELLIYLISVKLIRKEIA